MNGKWLVLAGELLETASGQFSNHGCNDWTWPADWTKAERVEFATAMVCDNVKRARDELTKEDREEIKHFATSEYGPPDWWVMAFLASRLQEPTT
jgi:hypothetical protein